MSKILEYANSVGVLILMLACVFLYLELDGANQKVDLMKNYIAQNKGIALSNKEAIEAKGSREEALKVKVIDVARFQYAENPQSELEKALKEADRLSKEEGYLILMGEAVYAYPKEMGVK